MTIEEFKKSQDYIDICYMVAHVKEENVREDVIKSLGYRIGLDFVKSDSPPTTVIKGKKNDFRVQITKTIFKTAKCAIVEQKKVFFQKQL